MQQLQECKPTSRRLRKNPDMHHLTTQTRTQVFHVESLGTRLHQLHVTHVVPKRMMASLFTINRYWGEERSVTCSGPTLGRLHELAEQRAAGRRRKGEDGVSESLVSKEDGQTEKSRRKRTKREFEREEPVSSDGMDSDAKRPAGVKGGEEEGEEEEKGEGRGTQTETEAISATSITSLVRESQVATKPAVHRQLPEWILHPTTVQADILTHSVPLAEVPLSNGISRNLQRMGVVKLFPIQVCVIPRLLASLHGPLLTHTNGLAPKDVCVCAPTGCGKTLCYVVPIVTALSGRTVCQVRAIVVLPSQELAQQVFRVFEQVAHGLGVRTALLGQQVSMKTERSMLMDESVYPQCSRVDVVVTTPGRLVEHLRAQSFASLRYLRFLVVDEADKLLDQKYQEWLPTLLQTVRSESLGRHGSGIPSGYNQHGPRASNLLKCVHQQCVNGLLLDLLTPIKHNIERPHPLSLPLQPRLPLQKLLFSATMTQSPEHLTALQLHQPSFVTVGTSGVTETQREERFVLPSELEELAVPCSLSDKPLILLTLLDRHREARMLCFTNSRQATHRLYLLIKHFARVSVCELSSSLTASQRRSVLERFSQGKVQLLICSDAMSRGMDVVGVRAVVNYEPPAKFKTYLHRVGRTARAGQSGTAYSLLDRSEVAAFNATMREGGRKKLKELTVSAADMGPLRAQYDHALNALRRDVINS